MHVLAACDLESSVGLSGEANAKLRGPIVNIIEGKDKFLGGSLIEEDPFAQQSSSSPPGTSHTNS